ncbi:uncharacterized protein ABIC63_000350 [Pseudacidovorax sp. 1753]|uniref:YceD family protein n=1 Tax=Pseudacidovorax sp. 1753 TaxID=3156419 RepID=UPI0033956D73
MKTEFDAARLDVKAFAQAGATLVETSPLAPWARLTEEAAQATGEAGPVEVAWSAHGEMRGSAAGPGVPWLHVEAEVQLPLVCQRCLGPVQTVLSVDRWFRFVADEATAAAEDEEADEDVLALAADFDLRALVEDELLMDIPVAPRHEVCPEQPRFSAADEDFDAAGSDKPNPFAVLEGLRKPKSESND